MPLLGQRSHSYCRDVTGVHHAYSAILDRREEAVGADNGWAKYGYEVLHQVIGVQEGVIDAALFDQLLHTPVRADEADFREGRSAQHRLFDDMLYTSPAGCLDRPT